MRREELVDERGAVMRARVGTVVIVALLCLLAFGAAGCRGGGSKPAAAPADKCRSLANFAESARQFAAFLGERSFDINKFSEGDWVRFQLLDLSSRPPDEIRDDVHVLADASSKFVNAIAGVDLSNLDQESLEKLQEFWAEIDQQRVRQASQNISAWVQKTCA